MKPLYYILPLLLLLSGCTDKGPLEVPEAESYCHQASGQVLNPKAPNGFTFSECNKDEACEKLMHAAKAKIYQACFMAKTK